MQRDLTKGNITSALVLFSLPMIAGNLLQQIYNLVDAWIVGQYLGADALAPVVGVRGIWSAIPIGWILADVTGLVYMMKMRGRK